MPVVPPCRRAARRLLTTSCLSRSFVLPHRQAGSLQAQVDVLSAEKNANYEVKGLRWGAAVGNCCF